MARMGMGADIAASNVPGLQSDAYLAGARIERLYGFGPLPGVSYTGGTLYLDQILYQS